MIGALVDKTSPSEHNVPLMMTLKQRLPVAWSIFRKNAGTLWVATATSHVPGLALIFIFAFVIKSEAFRPPPPDPGAQWDPTALWRSLGPLSKLSVFVGMFLNTTVPFAVGLSGVSYVVSCEHRGEDCDISELFPRMLKSSLLLIPMFLVLSFPWMIAHAFFFFPGVILWALIGFVPCAVALEQAGPLEALKISWSITSHQFGAIFTLWIFTIFSTLLTLGAVAILLGNLVPDNVAFIFIDTVGLAIVAGVEAFVGCILVGYYLDTRLPKQNLATTAT
jgi:hypothetical protein